MTRRRCHLVDAPTRPAPGPVVTVPPGTWRVALHFADFADFADGDPARIVVRPAPGAVGGACLLVSNRPVRRPRWSR